MHLSSFRIANETKSPAAPAKRPSDSINGRHNFKSKNRQWHQLQEVRQETTLIPCTKNNNSNDTNSTAAVIDDSRWKQWQFDSKQWLRRVDVRTHTQTRVQCRRLTTAWTPYYILPSSMYGSGEYIWYQRSLLSLVFAGFWLLAAALWPSIGRDVACRARARVWLQRRALTWTRLGIHLYILGCYVCVFLYIDLMWWNVNNFNASMPLTSRERAFWTCRKNKVSPAHSCSIGECNSSAAYQYSNNKNNNVVIWPLLAIHHRHCCEAHRWNSTALRQQMSTQFIYTTAIVCACLGRVSVKLESIRSAECKAPFVVRCANASAIPTHFWAPNI